MRQMVVTFNPDGTAEHTLKDPWYNPAEALGAERSIKRMTDIKYDEKAQGFYITFLRGVISNWQTADDFKNKTTRKLVLEGYVVQSRFEYQIGAQADIVCNRINQWFDGGVLMFKTYEDAVAYEIELVNALRKIGATF